VTWQVLFTKQAQKDAKKAASAGLRTKIESLLAVLAKNPLQSPPPYESSLETSTVPIHGELPSSIDWFISC